jgi:hypothetical protein
MAEPLRVLGLRAAIRDWDLLASRRYIRLLT